MDTRAMGHILAHSMDYQKPWQIRHVLSSMLGNGPHKYGLFQPMLNLLIGLLTAEGETHKQQVSKRLSPMRVPCGSLLCYLAACDGA